MKIYVLNNGQRLVANEQNLTVQINNNIVNVCRDKHDFERYLNYKKRVGVKHILAI